MPSNSIKHVLFAVLGAQFLGLPAAGALEQANGTTIPTELGCDSGRPTGLAATFACVCDQPGQCNIGDPCRTEGSCDPGTNATCETTLWHAFNDNTCIPSQMSGLDPRAEAAVEPQTFQPVCPMTFTMLTRGTALFFDAFGWYNVTGRRPEAADLHVMLDCRAKAGDSVVLDIQNHPDYAGGEIGFFLVTPEAHRQPGSCGGGDCCATLDRLGDDTGYAFFSEAEHNPDFQGASSYIHLLIYNSHVWRHTFYFAWEDIYGGSNHDFTDIVTSVSGVECAGGGMACDTGRPGVCQYGVTQCVTNDLSCVPLYEAAAEICDALDNDCDGAIDNGATCPDPRHVCHEGRCVPHCQASDEFTCAYGYECDPSNGFCIEIACRGVECPADQVCRGGLCVGGCEGAVCPPGQSCRLGRCVDPCRDVSCPTGQVCREGICINGCGQCDGIICDSPLVCDVDSGECRDPSCETCPPGTHCREGTCVDNCQDARCPAGQTCVAGACRDPSDPTDGGSSPVTEPTSGSAQGSASSQAEGLAPNCACRAHPRSVPNGGLMLLGALVALVTFFSRRRL